MSKLCVKIKTANILTLTHSTECIFISNIHLLNSEATTLIYKLAWKYWFKCRIKNRIIFEVHQLTKSLNFKFCEDTETLRNAVISRKLNNKRYYVASRLTSCSGKPFFLPGIQGHISPQESFSIAGKGTSDLNKRLLIQRNPKQNNNHNHLKFGS